MKRIFLLFCMCSCLVLAYDGSAEETLRSSSVLLVKFKEGVDPKEVIAGSKFRLAAMKRLHPIQARVAKYKKSHPEALSVSDEELFTVVYEEMSEMEKSSYRIYRLVLSPDDDISKARATLNAHRGVEYAEIDATMSIDSEKGKKE